MNYTTDDLGKDQKLTPRHSLKLSVQKKKHNPTYVKPSTHALNRTVQ